MDISQVQVLFDNPLSLVVDRKLSVALRDSGPNCYQDRKKKDELTQDDKLLEAAAHAAGIDLSTSRTDVNPTADLFSYLLDKAIYVRRQSQDVIRASGLASDNLRLQMSCLAEGTTGNLQMQVNEATQRSVRKGSAPDEVMLFAEASVAASDMVEQESKAKGLREEHYRGPNSNQDWPAEVVESSWAACDWMGLTVAWSNRLAAISVNNIVVIYPKPGIVMLSNKLSDLTSVLSYIWMCDTTTLESGAYNMFISFIRELIYLAQDYGQSFFTISKCLESLAAAESIYKLEAWVNDEFLEALNRDILTDTGFRYIGSALRRIFTQASIPLMHEMSCLGKILGHPLVNMEEGYKALYEATHSDIKIEESYILKTVREAKRSFLSNYYLRHGRWPPISWACEFLLVPSHLRMSWARNLSPDLVHSSVTGSHVTTEDMDYIDFEPIAEFDMIDNILPYLKDRTITALKSKVLDRYFSDDGPQEKISWKETRLLLAYLICPGMEEIHKDYIRQYTNAATLEELMEYLVIRIVPKEKELKTAFRGFGCKTYEDRMRGAIQEHNTGRYLDMYCREQAMTLSEMEILRKLNSLRMITEAHPGYKALYIVVDASKWNNRQRSEIVSPVMSALLDPLYNTSIFARTQEAFKNTFFYVPDETQVRSWQGQPGGIEGLNQYTWDVVYLAEIKACLADEKHKMYYLVKGDDLKIAVLVPPQSNDYDNMKGLKNRLVEKISSRAVHVGHKIKVEESFGSEIYFSFSKMASVGRILLPQGSRKIQKVYGANNAFLPFLDDMVGSAFSNAHGATQVTVDPVCTYYVALFWMFIHLCHHTDYKVLPDEALLALSLIPSLLGGFPVIYLHNMFVRAESDLLSPFLALLTTVKNRNRLVYRYASRFMKVDEKALIVGGHWTGLRSFCMDPYSLPIHKPDLPSSTLRRIVRPVAEAASQNRNVDSLFAAVRSGQMLAFFDSLGSANVFNGKIFSAVYAASPEGLLNSFIRKFESARSMVELMVHTLRSGKARKKVRTVVRAEIKLQQWRRDTLQDLRSGHIDLDTYRDLCPSEWARKIRLNLYDREIEGITMPPLQHQIIISYRRDVADDFHSRTSHFTYDIIPAIQELSISKPGYSVGFLEPFSGYTTSCGTTVPMMNFIEKNEILSQVKILVELAEWTNRTCPDPQDASRTLTPNMPLLIEKLIGIYTDKGLDVLSPFAGQAKSGTICHHVRAPKFRESIVPNIISNIYTRVKSSSGTHLRMIRTNLHYRVNFLHIKCYVTTLISILMHWARTPLSGQIWAVTRACRWCSLPIQETPIIMDAGFISLIRFSQVRSLKLGQIALEILKESLEDYRERRLQLRGRSDPSDLSARAAALGVLQEICIHNSENRGRIIAASTGHNLSGRGLRVVSELYSRSNSLDLNVSDIQSADLRTIVEILEKVVLDAGFRLAGVTARRTMRRICLDFPGLELPWAAVVQFLSDCGRLTEVITSLCRSRGMAIPTSALHPGPASVLVGMCVWSFGSQMAPLPRVLVRLSKYTTRESASHLRNEYDRYVKVRLRQVLDREHVQDNTGDASARKLERCLKAMAISLVPLPDPEDFAVEPLDDRSTHVFRFSYPSIPVRHADALYGDVLEAEPDDILETEDGTEISVSLLFSVVRQFRYESWEELDPDDDTQAQRFKALIEEEVRVRESWATDITYTSMTTCMARLREKDAARPRAVFHDHWVRKPVLALAHPRGSCMATHGTQIPLGTAPPSLPFHLTSEIPPRSLDTACIYQMWKGGNYSASRLQELIHRTLRKPGRLRDISGLTLADGMGGMAAVLADLPGKSVVVFTTLQRPMDIRGTDESPMSRVISEESGSVFDDSLSVSGMGDLTEKASCDAILNRSFEILHDHTRQAMDFVICDIEPSPELDVSSAEIRYRIGSISAVKIAAQVLGPAGVLYLKINLDWPWAAAASWSTASCLFRTVYSLRLYGCRHDSQEQYLVAANPHSGSSIPGTASQYPQIAALDKIIQERRAVIRKQRDITAGTWISLLSDLGLRRVGGSPDDMWMAVRQESLETTGVETSDQLVRRKPRSKLGSKDHLRRLTILAERYSSEAAVLEEQAKIGLGGLRLRAGLTSSFEGTRRHKVERLSRAVACHSAADLLRTVRSQVKADGIEPQVSEDSMDRQFYGFLRGQGRPYSDLGWTEDVDSWMRKGRARGPQGDRPYDSWCIGSSLAMKIISIIFSNVPLF